MFHLFKNVRKNLWAVTPDRTGQALPSQISWTYVTEVTKQNARFNVTEAEAAIKQHGVYFYRMEVRFQEIMGGGV